MRAVILLGTAAIAVAFLVPMVAPKAKVGIAVSDRFLERSNDIPSETGGAAELVTATTLRNWVTSHPNFAAAYAWRVMPLDLIFLAALGGFLAVGVHTLAALGVPLPLSRLPLWGWLIFPVAYIVTDLAEDILIIVLMTTPAAIGEATVTTLAALRNLKIGSSVVAIAQIFVLGVAGAIR